MKTIPVTIGFDSAQTIGTMTIDETKLPPGANYHFALGYSAQRIADGVPTEVEVREVSLVDDSKFVYADGRGARPVEPAASDKNEATRQVNAILRQLETDTGQNVESIELHRLDVTRLESVGVEQVVTVRIELVRQPGHEWSV